MGKRRRGANAFFDLNLDLSDRKDAVAMAMQLGLSGVAFNHCLSGPMADSHACRTRPIDLSALLDSTPGLGSTASFHRKVLGTPASPAFFRQYNRLTLVADTMVQAAALNAANPVLASFDLLAIRPTSQKVFEQACSQLEVDIISIDLCHRLPFRFKPSAIQSAIKRGIHFEVVFSTMFTDLRSRREFFANARMLQGSIRGRNIIISSGARDAMELRGPNDIANLATLFGLSREAAKASVSKNCEAAILRGAMRKKAYRASVIVEKAPSDSTLGSRDAWFDVPKVWDPLLSDPALSLISLTEAEGGIEGLFLDMGGLGKPKPQPSKKRKLEEERGSLMGVDDEFIGLVSEAGAQRKKKPRQIPSHARKNRKNRKKASV